MQLDGSLARFALRELFELCVGSMVDGAIDVAAPGGTHRLFFRNGQLVHAAAPSVSGFDAVWPLFELPDAPFRFVAGAEARERSIDEPTAQLIERATALAAQWAVVRAGIPSMDLVPTLTAPTEGEQVRIFEEDWPVLLWVDGTRTIAEVARCATIDLHEVCIGLLRLQERGLVRFEAQPASKAPEPVAPPPIAPAMTSAAAQPRGGFFGRLLQNAPDATAASTPATVPAMPTAAAQLHSPGEYDDILNLLRG